DADRGPDVDDDYAGDADYDDDPYVEYILVHEPDVERHEPPPPRLRPPRPAPSAVARPGPMPQFRPIDFAHNGLAPRPAPPAPGRIQLGGRFAPPSAARRRGPDGASPTASRPGHTRTEWLLSRRDPQAPEAGRHSA